MLKKYSLFFLTNFSIIFIDRIPKINEVIITTKIPNQFIVICAENNLKDSYTALAMIIGMLIKKEKSSASFFSTPTSKPHTKVEPLRDIPGSSASPCANPI